MVVRISATLIRIIVLRAMLLALFAPLTNWLMVETSDRCQRNRRAARVSDLATLHAVLTSQPHKRLVKAMTQGCN